MDGGDALDVNQKLPIALTIAGSDSGGGAGIQADLKTFAAFGVYAATVVTALTAQNTRGVRAIHYPPPGIVGAQIDAVFEDFDVAAIKIGMLGGAGIADVVAERLSSPHSPSRDGRPSERPLGRGRETLLPLGQGGPEGRMRAFVVYDPVMIASSGDVLSEAGFVEVVRHALLPLVDCLTPNLAEAAALLGEPIARSEADMARQGRALLKLGPRAVLTKGGHLDSEEAVDLLVTEDAVRRFAAPRLASKNLHGTGCTLSSAIAANIVLGASLPEAVAAAKAFVRQAIERGQDVTLGAGAGPLIQSELRSKL
ncbi:MAG TPA: bifunctional hydroxymethylpyrimidine kinase/phosphomethylpyrimidine kinase [Roseiarcus sp.]|jgi:hydroxymethylpyrimidine/phosphomethylpyrimidine kinase|nr:bifunctional hydroxymethylpyrimidine kinase/phosphomethylpyrimidine kinase [Roseiarcus sp.]